MTWVTPRLTSLLYGSAAGIAIHQLTQVDPLIQMCGFILAGLSTELYRGTLSERELGR